MTENSKVWTYIHKNNCYVAPTKDYAVYPLCRQKKSPSDARSINIKVKCEALTAVNNLENKNDTICRK